MTVAPPPQAVEAQEALLGALLTAGALGLEPSRELVRRIGETGLEPSHFLNGADSKDGRIYRTCLELVRRDEPADPLLVIRELERRGWLEEVGGRARVHELVALAKSTGNAGHFAGLVVEAAQARRTLWLAQKIAETAVNGYDPSRIAALAAELRAAAETGIADSSPNLVDGATWARGDVAELPPVWGEPHAPLWAAGEPAMVFGPDGVGKTTVCQQLLLARLGLRDGALGLPVAVDERRVVYIAADRPRQAQRSFARMVTEADAGVLRDRLLVWTGPPHVVSDPHSLVGWLDSLSAGTVFVDCLADLAPDLVKDEVGSRLKIAFGAVVAAGIELFCLHHPRKAQQGNTKPTKLADLYGSRLIASGMGSVVVLWGEPGDLVVELTHLKQPLEPVGPLTVTHDHSRGVSTAVDPNDIAVLLANNPSGLSAGSAAALMFATNTPTRNQTESARRRLERAVEQGIATKRPTGGSGAVIYVPRERP